MTVLCGWSLLVKVFPSTLASNNTIGRLQAPFGYWNAIGLCGAIGLPACLWAGARRDRGRLLAGLAAPALCLLLSVDVLSYSRSADAAGVAAIGLWLIFAPLRLRSIADARDRRRRSGGDQRLDAHPPRAQGRFGRAGDPGPRRPHVRDRDRARAGARHRLRVCSGPRDGPSRAARRRQTTDRLGAGRACWSSACCARSVRVATSSRGLTGEISHVWDAVDHDQRPRLRQRRRPRLPARLQPADLLASGDRRRRTRAVQGRRTARLRRRAAALHDQPERGVRGTRLPVRDIRRPGPARASWSRWRCWSHGWWPPRARSRSGSGPRRSIPSTPPSATGWSRWPRSSSGSASSRRSTGPGSSPARPFPVLLCAGWLAGRGPLVANEAPAERARGPRLPRPGARTAGSTGSRPAPPPRQSSSCSSQRRSSSAGCNGAPCIRPSS